MHRDPQTATGEFQEVEYGKWFTFRVTNDQIAIDAGFTHEVDVLDGVRFAVVKKTIAYVWTDDNEFGQPVTQKWSIKNTKFWR